MTDYSKLKMLAEAACGDDWAGGKAHDFMAEANPGTVLELLAENERLRWDEQAVTSLKGEKLFTFMSKDPCRYSLCEVTYASLVRKLIAERDKLKTALKDCLFVMENELKGLSVIQPEIKQAKEALALATREHGQ